MQAQKVKQESETEINNLTQTLMQKESELKEKNVNKAKIQSDLDSFNAKAKALLDEVSVLMEKENELLIELESKRDELEKSSTGI
ncbi:hypothetical protein NWQ33_06305 [Mycoplasmopsis cynos]|nr:hypothetical protein [Mycoplasmopsis cynos]